MDPSLLDPASVGMDAGMVAVVNEFTNRTKEYLDELGWGGTLNRLYPILPFVFGIAGSWLMRQSWPIAIKEGVMYGLWANFSFRAYKVTVSGR